MSKSKTDSRKSEQLRNWFSYFCQDYSEIKGKPRFITDYVHVLFTSVAFSLSSNDGSLRLISASTNKHQLIKINPR